MRKDASPAFEVAAIQLSDPAETNFGFQQRGSRVIAVRENLRNLITFAYRLHPSQVLNAPAWADTDYFDVDGLPDEPGVPTLQQQRIMYQKLLSDRFQLSFHRTQKELPVYILTAGKNGPKLATSARAPDAGTDQSMIRPGYLTETNATMGDLAGVLQFMVLDRPVLDRTGLAGHFDFTLRWTPDDSPAPGRGDGPPGLPTAIQEQLGLKLEATKASADVLIIDKVERPSAN
ncbi:MAG TPA: TIGR03435 family protein [Bryobacteraceae bacterium]|nr:TIGR03435 family protein [Bryobacteraceae bacterium]